jgi:hypothetical protein
VLFVSVCRYRAANEGGISVGNINIYHLETHMQIKTQPFKEAIEIKNSGIAFDVYGSGAKRIGDLAVTKNGLVWNNGNAQRAKGVTVKWDDFIAWMQSQTQTQTRAQIQTRTQTPPRAQTQPQTRTLTSSQTRAAPKAKIAVKPHNAIEAKKPAIKIAASAKTARKKAH